MTLRRLSELAFVLVVLCPALAHAQDPPPPAFEASVGYAAFVDESPINHLTVGGGWRWHVTRRFSVGPELVYMRGPGDDRDVFLTGKIVLDALPESRTSLYFVADAGIMLHRDVFWSGAEWYKEGAVSGGGGVRIDLGDRLYIAPEVRIGWEPHVRATLVMGWRGRQ